MILKYYELNKVNLKKNKSVLFFGSNEGFKNISIKNLIKNKKNIFNYEEKEILENTNNFFENSLSKSFFEDEKIVIIKRATDKIFKIIEEISTRKVDDLIIIVNAENLDKRSKLRSFYEKNEVYVSIAFYPDNEKTLSQLAYNFFKEKNILISNSDINLIVGKCNNSRANLYNELWKIECYSKSKKQINSEIILKLVNLNENFSISELIDNYLLKNKKKTINILNENNFSNEDCVVITRTFINKSKKILSLLKEYEFNQNIDLTISSAKPPIFWKDKEIIKQQISKWSQKSIKNLIFKLNDLELLIKKNVNNSINLISDFVLDQA